MTDAKDSDPIIDEPNPTVSAVVEMHSPDDYPEGGPNPEEYARGTAKLKAHLTSAGFEVHAPFHTSFSIGAKRSHFEEYFGTAVTVADDGLFTTVTVEGGGEDLSPGAIPEDSNGIVKRIFFMPPPDFVPR